MNIQASLSSILELDHTKHIQKI